MLVCPKAGGKDARADQKILFLFCLFGFGQKKKEDFLRMAKRTLVNFDNHAFNFALCLGVFVNRRDYWIYIDFCLV
jgi:hypothetical protein